MCCKATEAWPKVRVEQRKIPEVVKSDEACNSCTCLRESLGVQMVKNPPAMPETWVRFLGWEDPLEEGMATHSSILAWRIPWTEEPGRL